MLLLLTFEQKVAYMSAIKQVKRLTQPTSTRVAFNMSEPQKWYKPRIRSHTTHAQVKLVFDSVQVESLHDQEAQSDWSETCPDSEYSASR